MTVATAAVPEIEIGVWVDGSQKWVSGVTRRTTCHDLIRALLRAQNLGATDADVIGHTIVERWRKVERPLDHEQRILKVWKSWGESVHQVRFSLRRGRSGDLQDEDDDNPCKKRNKPSDEDRDNNHNTTTTNKNSSTNKENDGHPPIRYPDGGGTSLDEAESSCGRSERSRRRHKMRQSRREAVACQQRMQQKVHPLYHHHRPVDTSPQPPSDDSDGPLRKEATKPDQRRPPRDDPRYSETMERLMRLVVAQGETIQQQLRRLNQRQTQIESYEQQMHLLRVQSLGNDYLLSSYLHDQQHQPQEFPGHSGHNQDPGSRVAVLGGHHLSRGEPLPPGSGGERLAYGGINQPMMPPGSGGERLAYGGINQPMMSGLPMIREVHAKPINLHDDPGDLVIYGGPERTHDTFGGLHNTFGGETGRFSGRFSRFTNSKDETISEEKSNDSGVVIGDEILGSSVEERTNSEIEDFSEEEVQVRIVLLSKMEDVFSRLIHEEEVIHGLSSTIEVIETQQKLETAELESDLMRAAEEHSLLVAEARSNEQRIRVMDTSASQKKKLIDALLKDEVDSDQETRYLQAQLDYILHLPPTAFRLPEEGDDPPPLPPPPVHPACLVQSLLHHQPPQLVPPSVPRSSLQSRPPPLLSSNCHNSAHPLNAFVNRPPSPNILYINRAPSPTVLLGVHRAPSPNTRLVHRSCSPNRRKPRQPPSYDRVQHIPPIIPTVIKNARLDGVINITDSKTSLPNPRLASTNGNSIFKSSMSSSLPSLPNRTRPISILSKENKDGRDEPAEKNVSNNLLLLNQRTDNSNVTNVNSNTTVGESSEDIPPPLPSCPPPSLTPPLKKTQVTNNITTTIGNVINENLNNNRTNLNSNNSCTSINENTNNKRNILNRFAGLGKKNVSIADQSLLNGNKDTAQTKKNQVEDEDNESSSRASSPCLSPRSSTASETSLSNSSSASSTGISRHPHGGSYGSKIGVNVKIQRINNAISSVRSTTTNKGIIIGDTEKVINGNLERQGPCAVDTVSNGGKKDADAGDSNSDTGLSSLHSSSDEAGYPLDTLV